MRQTSGPGAPTMAVPPPVRIDDFARPRFPADLAALRESAAPLAAGCPLEPDALMEIASEQSGLADFGEPSFRQPLEVLCAAMRTEAQLGPIGVVAIHTQLVGLLTGRLRLVDLLRRNPVIRQEQVRRPIVITGLPRTGTTHLHNLLAADPALRHLPFWESLEPVPPADEQPADDGRDPRVARADAAVAMINAAMPLMRRMHEMTTEHAHEEIQLLAMAFSTMYFETLAPIPSYRDWYESTDQTPAYAFLRTALQALQWLRGGERWVLKSPQHLGQLEVLRHTFPDATVVVTHRDPVVVTGSMAALAAYTARMHYDELDPARIGGYWADRVETLLRSCVAQRDAWPPDASVDLPLPELVADEMAAVERIYAVADQPLTDRARQAMAAYARAHPRGRHGRVSYDLTELGIDADERRGALAFYAERFGLTEETRT